MQIFDLLGNATAVFFFANTLYVISYMLTSMIWLRVLAIIAAASTFPYFYFQAEPLWSALFWQSCFLAVNLVNLLILLWSRRSASFDEEEHQAYDIMFSELKPWEVRPIFKYAHRRHMDAGCALLEDGQENESLYLILEGRFTVIKDGVEVAVLQPGQFVGELSFLGNHVASADVIAAEEARLMFWNREQMAPLFKRQGLYESYFYSLCSLDVASKLRAMTADRAVNAS